MSRTLSTSFCAAQIVCLIPLLLAQSDSKHLTSQANDPQPFLGEKKVAIVIGISDYPSESGFPKLQYAAKDAQDLASALEKHGYTTHLLTDQHAMKSSIQAALQQAQDQLNQDRVGSKLQGTILFAFSGHGGQKDTGANAKQYLVTYDSNARGGDFGYPLKEIAEALNNSGAARKMMFIDACRDLTASSSKGIPALSSFRDLRQAQGIKTFFSTAPGAQSYENEEAHNGYFTHYLLQGLSGKAATPDGLITFDSLAKWVIHAMRSDPKAYQTPYWNQNASGDFYIAGQLANKEALVIGIDNYADQALHSAIAGAKPVSEQLEANGFDAVFLENAPFSEFQARLDALGKNLGPNDVALFYFAGEGGIASGKPFLMAADAKLPAQAIGGKWEKPPEHSITLADVMDKVRQNHPGPNIFLLDMGMPRASSADTLDLAALRREHTLVLFSCKPGQEPERSQDGTLFSRTFVKVLKEPKMSASYAASKIMSAVFDQSNGVQYVIEIPMLPDRVYLTPSQ
jgi:hypothetical protein